jgi:hypothetical protein
MMLLLIEFQTAVLQNGGFAVDGAAGGAGAVAIYFSPCRDPI